MKKKNENKKSEMGDDRFAAVAFDPRFQRFPKAKSKVKVDERFKDMFENPAFQVGSVKDKRGRKIKKKMVDEARRYYRLEDEEGKQGKGKDHHIQTENNTEAGAPSNSSDEANTASDVLSEEDSSSMDEAEERWARMRGLVGPDESSGESESESDEDEDVIDVEGVADDDLGKLYEEWGVGAFAANPNEEIPLLPDATPRLACLDLDWEHVRAVDILVALKSFVPDGGTIKSVTVYPSDYGLNRMKVEAESGPQGIWKSPDKGEESKEEGGNNSDGGAVDHERLRHYERSKLRWYYAIVVCDSSRTANAIYSECDGMELMKTANLFDLRFVPNGDSFEGRQVRDSATEVPADYAAPVFQTKALQHTNVDLTWDKTDDSRKKTLSRKLKEDDLKEEELQTYLASESESSGLEDDELAPAPVNNPDAIRERYQKLLVTSIEDPVERKGVKDWGNAVQASDGDDEMTKDTKDLPPGCVPDKSMELQVTFEQGLENLEERLKAKQKDNARKEAETVWEAYLRRKREKREKARRKGKVNYHSEEEDSEIEAASPDTSRYDEGEDDQFNDPFFLENDTFDKKEKSAKKKSKEKKEGNDESALDKKKKAEFEMLLMDGDKLLSSNKAREDKVPKKKLTKKDRIRQAKAKKRTEREVGSDIEDMDTEREFLNMEDPRFQAVFQNTDFALDPTDPRFTKAGRGAAKLAAEAALRRSKKLEKTEMESKTQDTPQVPKPASKDADLKLMVASLKRKSSKQQGTSKKRKW